MLSLINLFHSYRALSCFLIRLSRSSSHWLLWRSFWPLQCLASHTSGAFSRGKPTGENMWKVRLHTNLIWLYITLAFKFTLPGDSSTEHSHILFFLFRSASDDSQRGAQLSWCHSDSSVVNYSSLTFANQSCSLGSLKPNRHHLVESYQLLHFDVPVLILSSSVIPLTKSVHRQTPTEVLYDSSHFSRCHQNYVLP